MKEREDARHLLTSVFTTVSLYDELEVIVRPQAIIPGVTIETTFAHGITAISLPAEDNLIYRAIYALADILGRPLVEHFTIRLTKNIPVQAGLGGGSSDCAAMLLVLAKLWNLDIEGEPIQRVAQMLGSDINFFLTGGCALFDHFGDRLVRCIPAPELDIVIAKPYFGIPTHAVYQTFDEQEPAYDTPEPLIGALESCVNDKCQTTTAAAYHHVASNLFNNLTHAACIVEPALTELFDTMTAYSTWTKPMLSGSGSALFTLCPNKAEGEHLVKVLRSKGQWATMAVNTTTGAHFIE